MNEQQKKLQKTLTHRWKFSLYMLMKLPSIFWWGVRLQELDEERCVTTISYTWRSQNPFRSIYFSAQNGAGELSTGLLVLLHTQGLGQWSMLVTECRTVFTKKAVGRIEFRCADGGKVRDCISRIMESGEPETVILSTTGYDEQGDAVSSMDLQWSLKRKG